MYTVKIINEFDEEKIIEYNINEYNSLMEMIFDVLHEEIGECKGKAWCGTCHVFPLEGDIEAPAESDEITTLSKLYNTTPKSRLACQINADHKINGMTFKILSDGS